MRVIVVGGGVLGAMHALWAHDAGHQVVHLERETAARGASVRNFGLVWVGGRAAGEELRLALAARQLWEIVAQQIPGVGWRAQGSLTVARTEDELLVMKEAASLPDASERGYRLLDPAGVRAVNPAVRGAAAGGLYCKRDAIVEPRQVPAAIREHLRTSTRYRWTPLTEVVQVRAHGVLDGHGEWHDADLVICCTGAAHHGVAAHAGPRKLRRVRLQMLQTARYDQTLTTSVADADSLRYYPAYDLPAESSSPRRIRLALHGRASCSWFNEQTGSSRSATRMRTPNRSPSTSRRSRTSSYAQALKRCWDARSRRRLGAGPGSTARPPMGIRITAASWHPGCYWSRDRAGKA
jgi:FAD dependent oxidoreductase TIGR03364